MRGIYVHLPFCTTHCTYCPFAISTDLALQDAYVDALSAEIEDRAEGEEIATVYFGGGTPSKTSVANLRRLMEVLRSRFSIDAGAEISLEANPEDVNEASLEAWREIGVTRISIGVQSFEDSELAAISRVHDAATARRAVTAAAAAGFHTNLDIIAGLPGQTAESFEHSLDAAIALGAGHVSLYMLDLDEPTPLGTLVDRGRVVLPGDDAVALFYESAVPRLEAAGLHQYETSNFARRGEECRHNLLYWDREEYYGFGLAAHSFLREARFANSRNIREYLAEPAAAQTFHEQLDDEAKRRETILLSLRQKRGIEVGRLIELSGKEGAKWVERGLAEGWLTRREARVGFTSAGFLVSNELIAQLF